MRFHILLIPIVLTACAGSDPLSEQSSSSSVSSVSFSSEQAASSEASLETYPSIRSLEHLSTMRLEGTDFSLDSIEADNAAYTRHAISYRSNGVKVTGILNIPKGDEQFPLLIFNHGYIDPAIYTQGRGLKREQDYMARQGFAVLHTDYRGHAGGDENPDKTEVYDAGLGYAMDSINAILAVKNANLQQIDTSKVGMLGHSMGGGVSMNAAIARPDLIDALVLYAPVHSDPWQNFLRWRADSKNRDVKTQEVLQSRDENPEAWNAMAARPRLSTIEDPVMLFHGTNDKDVPVAWSDELEADLNAAGKTVTYIKYPGEGHEFGPKWGDFMRQSAEFFRESFAHYSSANKNPPGNIPAPL